MIKIKKLFPSLKNKDFRYLITGHLISRIGTEMQTTAINWHIYQLTGSPYFLALIGLIRFLCVLSFAPLGGIISDKFDRKKVMLVSQILLLIFSGFLAYLTFTGKINVFLIYLLIALSSIISVFDTPARQSIVPHIVSKEQLTNAVSLTAITWQAAIVMGPAIGGFVIASLGEGWAYLLNSVSFLAIIIALSFINVRKIASKEEIHINWASFQDGFRFVFTAPLIYSTMFLDFFATFFSSALVLMPIFAKDILKVGPEGLGILYAAPSLGAVTAGLIISSIKKLPHQGEILILSVAIYGLTTFLFGISNIFALSLVFLFFAGASDAVSTVIRNTVRQLTTPDSLRGRMVAINMVFFMGGPQLGEAEAGLLAGLLGTSFSVAIGGIGTIIAAGIIARLVPELRKYKG